MLQQSLDRVGESGRIIRFEEYAVVTVVDDLGQTARSSGSNRHTTRERLQAHEQTNAFSARRQDEQVGRTERVDELGMRNNALEPHELAER